MSTPPNRRRWFIVATTLGSAFLLALMLGGLYASQYIKHHGENNRRDAIRAMVDDDSLLNLSEGELIARIGIPDKRSSGPWSLHWSLGERKSSSLMFPHRDFLVVEMRDGTSVKAVIVSLD